MCVIVGDCVIESSRSFSIRIEFHTCAIQEILSNMSDLQQKEAMNECTSELPVPGSSGLLDSLIKRTACTSIGQSLLKHADRFLWTTEKCAQWAMPQTKVEDEGGKLGYRPELVRPLPWVLFLPALVALRALRVGLSLILLLLGKHPLQPAALVRYIQERRRRLRAIKFHGCRGMRMQRQSAASGRSMRSNLLRSLSGLVSSAMCMRQPMKEPEQTVLENATQDKTQNPGPQSSDKRKYREIENSSGTDEDLSDEEQVENFLDMVDRLAAISDADDPDYTVDSEFTEELSEDLSDVEDDEAECDEPVKTKKSIHTSDETVEAAGADADKAPALPARNPDRTQNSGTNGTASAPSPPPPLAPKKQHEDKPKAAATPKIAQNGRSASSYKEDYRPFRLATSTKSKKAGGGLLADPSASSPALIESEQRAQTLSVDTEDQFYSPVSSSCASPEPNEIAKMVRAEQHQSIIETGRLELPSQDSRL